MYLKTQGLVLRVAAYNDNDALLTVLTKSHGKITVKARGLRRKNTPLSAPCQLLTYSEFTLFEYRGMYTINEAQALELFQALRKSLEKLALGTYFAQVAELLGQEDSPTPELLSLILNCLYALDKLDLPDMLIKAVFELRCACIAGYMPELSGCYRCGNPHPERFNIIGGRLECTACREADVPGLRLPLTAGALDSMRYICYCDPQRLFAFHSGDESLQSLSSISESYLASQLEHGFSTLDFYKSLMT